MEKEKQITENVTPTWESLVPLMLDILTNDQSSRIATEMVKSEFIRMAIAADSFNKLMKEMQEETVKNC
jgi:hypothetical protein